MSRQLVLRISIAATFVAICASTLVQSYLRSIPPRWLKVELAEAMEIQCDFANYPWSVVDGRRIAITSRNDLRTISNSLEFSGKTYTLPGRPEQATRATIVVIRRNEDPATIILWGRESLQFQENRFVRLNGQAFNAALEKAAEKILSR